MGYDIGTRFIKTCIVEDNKILGFSIRETGMDLKKSIDESSFSAIEMAGIKKRKIAKSAATGYGCEMLEKTAATISEDVCLVKAAYHLDRNINTVIDVGGLFIHIATVISGGRVGDHCENEKCAAGSGKFLEIISEAVDIPIASISETALKSSNPYALSNSCSVFAESEVISQINAGTDSSDIIAGVINTIAEKIATLINRIEAPDKIAVAGGVAKIEAFRIILEKVLNRKIFTLPVDFQIVTAYGAALHAQDKPVKKNKRKN